MMCCVPSGLPRFTTANIIYLSHRAPTEQASAGQTVAAELQLLVAVRSFWFSCFSFSVFRIVFFVSRFRFSFFVSFHGVAFL